MPEMILSPSQRSMNSATGSFTQSLSAADLAMGSGLLPPKMKIYLTMKTKGNDSNEIPRRTGHAERMQMGGGGGGGIVQFTLCT